MRELQNVIERAVVLCPGTVLDLGEGLLPVPVAAPAAAGPTALETRPRPAEAAPELASLEEVERSHILAVLHRAGWLIEGPRGAAKILGLHPNTLRSRMDRLGLKRPSHGIS